MAYSRYFRAAFTYETKEKNQNSITFPTIQIHVLKLIVDFAYTGNVSITGNNVQDLLIAANLLDVPLIVDDCTDYIMDHLDSTNFVNVLTFASNYELVRLRSSALSFAAQHFFEPASKESLVEVPTDALLELIGLNDLGNTEIVKIKSAHDFEMKLYNIVRRYIEYKEQERSHLYSDALELIRLPFIDIPYHEVILADAQKFGQEEKVKKLLKEAKSIRKTFPMITTTRKSWTIPRVKNCLVFTENKTLVSYVRAGTLVDTFSHVPKEKHVRIKTMIIWIGTWDGHRIVSGIETVFTDGSVTSCGQTDIQESYTFELQPDEYISRIEAYRGFFIDNLTFFTNTGNTFGPYGGDGGSHEIFQPEKDSFLFGLKGCLVKDQGKIMPIKVQFVWAKLDLSQHK